MRNRTPLLLLLTGMLLLSSACAGKSPETQPPPTATDAATAVAQNTTAPFGMGTALDVPGCTVSSPIPTPGPTQQSLFPASKDTDWAKGPEDAKVTIIEYSDFQ